VSDPAERLEALAARHALAPGAVAALAALLEMLADDPRAPTTVRDPRAAIERHVADALSALELPEVRDARTIADLGSGAGVPGLVLAAALPQASVALVESTGRKCAFLTRAVAAMGIANARVVHARAEAWPDGQGAHELVTARALGELALLAEYAAPLLRPGGALVAWKGARDADEERRAALAATELGLAPGVVHAVRPFPGARDHTLHVYLKVGPTPDRFPRRPGIARKRPLGRG